MRARSGGPANHWPQQPFPDLSEGDLKIEQNGKQIFSKAAGKWQGKMLENVVGVGEREKCAAQVGRRGKQMLCCAANWQTATSRARSFSFIPAISPHKSAASAQLL